MKSGIPSSFPMPAATVAFHRQLHPRFSQQDNDFHIIHLSSYYLKLYLSLFSNLYDFLAQYTMANDCNNNCSGTAASSSHRPPPECRLICLLGLALVFGLLTVNNWLIICAKAGDSLQCSTGQGLSDAASFALFFLVAIFLGLVTLSGLLYCLVSCSRCVCRAINVCGEQTPNQNHGVGHAI